MSQKIFPASQLSAYDNHCVHSLRKTHLSTCPFFTKANCPFYMPSNNQTTTTSTYEPVQNAPTQRDNSHTKNIGDHTPLHNSHMTNPHNELDTHTNTQQNPLPHAYYNTTPNTHYTPQFTTLLQRYTHIFSQDKFNVPCLRIPPVKIPTNSEKIITIRPYRVPICDQQEIRNQIQQMLENGIIEQSFSPFSSPVTLVTKRDKTKRFCIDYRKVNELISSDVHPLPRIEDILDRLAQAKYFSTADISSAYWQVPIHPDSRPLLAFATFEGLYQPTRLPFGLKTSPQIYERAISQVLQRHGLDSVAHYFDDFIIYSNTLEEHQNHLRQFFAFCEAEKLQLNFAKCEFFKQSINFLGYTITAGTITPLTRNTDIIHAIKQPHNRKTLQSFLGAVNVYNKFIPEYARLRAPLNNLLKKDVLWNWNEVCQKAFIDLKGNLTQHPILHLYKEGLPCQVYCDASTLGIAGILKQVHPDGNIYPVQYFSRTLRPHEKNYSISELECLAIVESVEKFRIYLMGRKFTIFSDHHALQWLKTIKNPSGRLFRWSLRLSSNEYEVRYIKGKLQYEADLLSRNPFCGFLDATLIKTHQPPPSKESSLTIDRNGLHTVSRKGVTKIILPKPLIQQLLQTVHTQYNHPGISQMSRIISTQYYWQGMSKDIKQKVKTCPTCQLTKRPVGPTYGELSQPPESKEPFDLLSLDTIAGFAKYGNTKIYLHVVVDHFSRYAWAFPSKSTSTTTYQQVLKRVSQDGSPKRLLTDRAPAFTSPKFRSFLLNRNIHPLLTTSNNPQANGLCERLNATLTGKLRLLHLENPKVAWTKLVKKVTLIYNKTPHSTTGFPPIYLMFGILPPEISNHNTPYPDIDKARKIAHTRTQNKHLQDKNIYDQRHKQPHFEVGDLVLVKLYHHPNTGKLAPYFTGPHTILEIISPNVVRIDRPNQPLQRDTDTIHVNKLKLYTEKIHYISPPAVSTYHKAQPQLHVPFQTFNTRIIPNRVIKVEVMAGFTQLKTKMVLVDGSLRHTCQLHCLRMEADTEEPGLQIQGHFAEDEYLPEQGSPGSATPISVGQRPIARPTSGTVGTPRGRMEPVVASKTQGFQDGETQNPVVQIKDVSGGLPEAQQSPSRREPDVRSLQCQPRPAANQPREAVGGPAQNAKIDSSLKRSIIQDIGLRRQFQWPFVIANTNRAIIGADFLNNFGLIIDVKNKRLIDGITNLSIRGVIQSISDMGNISTLNSSSKVSAILTKYPNLCRPPSDFVEAKHSVKHYIPTRGQPIHSKARRLDSQRLTLAKAEFQYMLNNGIIRPSNSPWASPLHLVSKKDESLRPCGDYRRLNAVTLPDRYPIPRLDDFHHILKGTRVYSKIDLCKAFYQIPIAEEDKPKTAIITPFGLFEFNVMSFGLRNATATFQRFMHEVLRNLDFAFVYLDDILVASKTEEEHYSHLEILFSRLNTYGLRINLSKSKFLVQEIDFLGYLITSHGVKPLPTKVKAILEYKKPKTVHELRIFLGMLNFYRTFLNNAAETQAILHEYLRGAKKKDRSEIKWTKEAEVQFEKCKQALANTALLAYPDTELPISLCTDASDRAVGSVLQQLDNNNWKPIAFFSKKLNPAQCNYSTYDRELLAIYLSIKFFKHLLEAREFTILTDHKPLIYAFKQKNEKASPKQLRHLQYISQFTTDIKYIKGTDNIVADALSRVDAITTIDYEEIAKEQTGDSELQNLISKNTSLKFKQCPLQSGNLLWCDVSTNNIRPFIPIKFRMMVFRNFHELSHPGIKATTKQLTSRFIWPNMNKDIRKWARACVNCQKCKVSIHTKSEIGKYQEVDERFSVVHIDLIGALPPSNGNIYCLTCIDRYTSWMEVVPLPDMKSETIARAFYENWIVRFGAPHTVISDRGKQFTSQLFKDLTTLCGIKLRHSTAYHPQCNGKIERLHRTIKTAIRAHNSIKWTETLPTVLLGLRAAINKDNNHSLSQMVYGKTIRLPGEFFDASKHHLHAEEFVQQLQRQMELLKPLNEKHHSKTKVFVHKDLKTCSHVFIRTDRVKKPLEPPYEGPFPVLERTDKYFTLKVKGKNVTTSIDRLRPAYLLADSDNITAEYPTAARPIVSGALPSTSSQQNPDPPDVEKYTEFQGTGSAPDLPRTRSGRIIKKPVRFKEQ
ncbi:hypothetical protein LAZ67_23001432 [Cordylochernes scorpioides]|uniref:RNA-directed DNA polymerase n=1 Tax=Cordylochernes scorpioides TaxID=51811 RepID=A0ABY6LQN0_9ARAC|nr:hypothetical protein LAZ67_23001432 [Cordylochernes scorpioides]